MSSDILLFNGEMCIGKAGIFTYCHEYTHPSLKIAVKLIGTNHLGERSYYRKIRQLLHDTSNVLYEYLSRESTDELSEDLVDLRRDIYGSAPPVQKFISALLAYFTATDLYFSGAMTMEATAFQNGSSNKKWISIAHEQSCDDREKKLVELCARIPEHRQKSVVDHVRRALDKISNRSYTPREYGESFSFFWSDEHMRAIFDEVFVRDQAKFCMQLLDVHAKKNSHGTIGIKFGVAHIPNIRAALFAKGFAHVKSNKLCAISFS